MSDSKGVRFIRFWGAVLTFQYLKDTGKRAPQTDEEIEPIEEIYLRICLAAERHGLLEGRAFIEIWELE